MKAQRISIEGGKPFAVRIQHEPSAKIQRGKAIVPIPELGGMACNFETFDGLAIRWWRLDAPEDRHGIKAKIIAEAWATRDGEPEALRETWLATRTPKGHESLAHFIGEYLKAEGRQLDAEATRRNPPVMAHKGNGQPVDIRHTTRAAMLALLREQHPQTFKALDSKQDNETVFRAYTADLWALRGSLDADTLAQLASDKAFTRWLATALAKPGNVPRWKWQLALGWIRDGLHAMRAEEFAAAMNSKTGEKLTRDGWRKRRESLGLVSSAPEGRPDGSTKNYPLKPSKQ